MTRAQILLVLVGVGVVAIVAGVITALVIANRAQDDTRQHERAAADATATRFVETRGIKTSTPVELGTPIPAESLSPVTLMFCEPLQQAPGTSNGTMPAVAVVQSGTQVYYKPGTCEPDVDANSMVAVDSGNGRPATDSDGAIVRVTPAYVAVNSLNSFAYDGIIWTPAKGDLDGVTTIMTGRYLRRDAEVVFDSLGSPMLRFNTNDDGQQIFGSMSERLVGLPLATFLDGQPLRGEHGQILAPTIQSRITDAGMTTGLSLEMANRLAALINNGLAQ